MEKVLDETFKPIVNPLERLVDATIKRKVIKISPNEQNPRNVIELSSNNDKEEEEKEEGKVEEESESNLEETIRTEAVDTSFETAESEVDDEISQSFRQDEDEDETESFKQAYLQTSQKRTNTLDNTYGVRIENDVLKIGNSLIHFTKRYIKVENINYPKTAGLLQLLFQKQPDSKQISSNDIQSYRKIVEVTRAFIKKL